MLYRKTYSKPWIFSFLVLKTLSLVFFCHSCVIIYIVNNNYCLAVKRQKPQTVYSIRILRGEIWRCQNLKNAVHISIPLDIILKCVSLLGFSVLYLWLTFPLGYRHMICTTIDYVKQADKSNVIYLVLLFEFAVVVVESNIKDWTSHYFFYLIYTMEVSSSIHWKAEFVRENRSKKCPVWPYSNMFSQYIVKLKYIILQLLLKWIIQKIHVNLWINERL